jgi:hypothetical protein
VVCDESQLDASLALFKQLNPQLIVGPVTGNALTQLVASLPTTPIFSPLGDAQTFVTSPPINNTHFFCSPNRAAMVAPFQSAIDVVARYASTLPGHNSTPKVAVVENSKEPNEDQFAGSITNNLTIAGQPVSLTPIDLGTDLTQTAGQGVAQADAVATAARDVVVLTGPVWAESFIYQVEGRWSLAGTNTPRPLYLVFRRTDALASYAAGAKPSVSNRVFALDVYRDASLTKNYEALQGVKSLLQSNLDDYVASSFNDCLFAAMYATAAAAHANNSPAVSVTPAHSAGALGTIAGQSSYTVNLTTDGVQAGLGLIGAGTQTQLVGSSVYLGDYLPTGAPQLSSPQQSLALYCMGSGGAGGTSQVAWESAGITYSANSAAMGGVDGGAPSISCP